ncbi:MAG TPA: hypothetical protein VME40_06030 [Caulobacteraceae bacterium]|nr:hypothetical protein [Caulobacteraceae bacterium]
MDQTIERRRPRARRPGRAGAAAASVVAHAGIAAAIALTWVGARPTPEQTPIVVSLIRVPILAPAAPAAAPKSPTPVEARHDAAPAKPAPSLVQVHASREPPSTGASMGVSDSELASAASADSGPGGGECNMARRLQSALRRDPLVQAAVAQTGARAIMVWNGDWVQSEREDGKGLAALREAVMWEIAFAPPACRAQSMRGLVTLSLNASPGAARVALGAGTWRWSDLLASPETTLR